MYKYFIFLIIRLRCIGMAKINMNILRGVYSVQVPAGCVPPFVCQIKVQSSTEQNIAIITLYYCLVCSISCSVTSYPAVLFRLSCFLLHLSSLFQDTVCVLPIRSKAKFQTPQIQGVRARGIQKYMLLF